MKCILLLIFSLIYCGMFSQWDNGWFPNPDNYVSKYEGKPWYRVNWMSDGFNDGWVNGNKWKRSYLNSWNAKGRTRWNSWQDYVQVGSAWGRNCAKIGHYWNDESSGGWANTVSCGIISSQNTVKYPVYLEANIRVANAALSSNFWLLEGGENRREIDVVECYGGNPNNEKRATSNYHFFTGSGRDDYFNKKSHWKGSPWRDGFHRFGVLWLSPWDVRFYVDGSDRGHNFFNINLKTGSGLQLNKDWWNFSTDMHIILDVEEHRGTMKDPVWKYKQGLSNDDRKMFVDYIGVWKPNFGGKDIGLFDNTESSELTLFPNPVNKGDEITLSGVKEGQSFSFTDLNGKIISSFEVPHDDKLFFDTSDVSPGIYMIRVDDEVIKLIIN